MIEIPEPTLDDDEWRWRGNKPSVTTVIKNSIANRGLDNWLTNNSANAIKKRQEETSAFGTECHRFFELFLRGELKLSEVPETHKAHVMSFMEWVQKNDVQPLYLEQPLASEEYGYSGQTDLIGTIRGNLFVADWKITGTYAITNGYQLAAYRQAAIECELVGPDAGIIGVQVERDTAVVKEFKYKHIDFCFHKFLAGLEIFKGLHFYKLQALKWPWLHKQSLVKA